MAQRGRPRKTDSRPASAHDTRTEYRCTRCGRDYKSQRGYFPYNQSSLYEGNNHYCTICFTCLDELYTHYTEKLGSEAAAVRRICSKLDWYFDVDAFDMTDKSSMESSRVGMYSSKLALKQYKGKTFDTTLDEEYDGTDALQKSRVSQKTRDFFGSGLSDDDLQYLEKQYKDWTAQYECKVKSQEELFKNLSFAQLNILKAQRTDNSKKVMEAMRAFQDLLKTQNIAPLQRNDNTLAEQNTFGTLIRKWEDTRPIPEPAKEWQDVDGIVRYITIYFLGHLCKMLRLQNRYSQMYEQEMAKLRVSRPEIDDSEDSEASFDKIYGDMMESS